MFFVYALYNKTHNKIYIGQTDNLDRRVMEHNDRLNNRHNYTKAFDGEWKLIYKEETITRKEALIREKQLKSYQGRLFIRQHIPL